VSLEKDGKRLVVDPGLMTGEPEALSDIDCVLVTHEHFDHFEPHRLRAALADNQDLVVYTCPGVAKHLRDVWDRVEVVQDDDAFTVSGFAVSVIGRKHHASHPDAPPVDNIGFLVDSEVFHPGDALTIVDAPTLLAPCQAPWLTVPDLVAYLRTAQPRRAYAVRDGLMNVWGLRVIDDVLRREAERTGRGIRRLLPGEAVNL
ncbi:MBL fold metallo-hydrolase, partial [Streptomyces sp900116325]|uniref:MBL fold metallo-hydrolase n=1 Tax=Streptomyces sp. 900116325 TaxID=3154295 RepID=UPI0033F3A084